MDEKIDEKIDENNLKQYIGRSVRVLNAASGGRNMQGDRLKVGDVITVDGYSLTGRFRWTSCGVRYAIPYSRVELVPLPTVTAVAAIEPVEPARECKCVTLFHGHHFGCPYYKEL